MIPRVFRARLKPGRRAAYEALIRFAEWQASGVWERVWQTFFDPLDAPERLVWAPALLPGRPVPRQRTRASGSARAGGAVVRAASSS